MTALLICCRGLRGQCGRTVDTTTTFPLTPVPPRCPFLPEICNTYARQRVRNMGKSMPVTCALPDGFEARFRVAGAGLPSQIFGGAFFMPPSSSSYSFLSQSPRFQDVGPVNNDAPVPEDRPGGSGETPLLNDKNSPVARARIESPCDGGDRCSDVDNVCRERCASAPAASDNSSITIPSTTSSYQTISEVGQPSDMGEVGDGRCGENMTSAPDGDSGRAHPGMTDVEGRTFCTVVCTTAQIKQFSTLVTCCRNGLQ